MENLFFYPTVTNAMLEDAGCDCSKYEFSYCLEGVYHTLKAKGKNTIKLDDKLETWKIKEDGLRIIRQVTIGYPEILKGKDGIACKDAEVGICIIWTNRTLTQMGYIMPESFVKDGKKEIYNFKHIFPSGEIDGDLTLDTVIYIKKAALSVEADEKHLINEAGVTVGAIDSISLNFDNVYMDFPIRDVKDAAQPLWWLELNDWEDPRSDYFNEDHVCLYLNSAYNYCPKVGDTIKNIELLIEIISSAYLMIIRKIEEAGYLNETLNDIELELGSISKVMYYFYASCEIPLRYDSIDSLQKTIHQNIENMLRGE